MGGRGKSEMIAGGRAAGSWPRPNARDGDSKKSPRVYPGRCVLLQVIEVLPSCLVPLDDLLILGKLTPQGLQFGPLTLNGLA